MKRKFSKILGVGLTLALLTSLLVTAAPAVAADPVGLNLISVGVDSTAEWVDAETMAPQAPHTGAYSLKLYALDGQEGGAGVYIPVNVAIKDINSLSFSRLGTIGDKDAKINLLIDADNDGDLDFTAIDALEYHRGAAEPEVLGEDAMLFLNPNFQIDTEVWATVDAYNVHKYFGKDKTGLLLSWSPNNDFLGQEGGVQDVGVGVIDPTDKVLGVIVLLGCGSGVADQTVYIDDIEINGIPYPLEWTHVSPIQVDDDRADFPDAPFQTIQGAIDSASPNDTIDVAAGTYTENLVIDKQLTLQGAGSTSTIIDASGGTPGILLEAGGVSATQRMVIKDLRITGSTLGTGGDGIRAYKVGGFNLDYVTLENLLINLNADKGVELHNGTTVYDLEIKDCEFINNGGAGLRASSATPVNGLTITNSHLDSNKYGGYLCGGVSNLTVSSTTMNGNSKRGWYCSEIGKITNIKFENCEANNNDLRGITIFTYSAEGIDGVEIRNTEIKNNLQRGLHIGAATDSGEDVPSPIKNVLVEDCDILDNGKGTESDKAGFHLDIGALTNVVVRNCTIIGNSGFGVYNADTYSSGVVDATLNWWGDVAGPDTSGNTMHNPYQNFTEGDAVSDGVDYLPWLIQIELVEGWNIWSVPVILDEACLPQLAALTEAMIEGEGVAYYFDSSTQDWYNIPEDASRMDAWYIKMLEPVTVNIWASSEATFPWQKEMKVGWNFVGLAELYDMPVNEALSDALYGTGEADLVGYSRVKSPSLNGASWTYLRDQADGPNMIPTKGYWVFMVNDGVLGGFTETPIVEVAKPIPGP